MLMDRTSRTSGCKSHRDDLSIEGLGSGFCNSVGSDLVPTEVADCGLRSLLRSYSILSTSASIDRLSLRDWQSKCLFRDPSI
jgi:hypothetical protein